MSLFKRNKNKANSIEKSLQGVIVVSPLIWILINVSMLLMFFLILPKEMMISKLGMLFLLMALINGWFWAALLSSYLFRDASHKFVAPNINASLGEHDGFLTIAPEVRENGKIVEPEFIIRVISGFSAYGIHTKGRVIVAYPTQYEHIFPDSGIICYTWLRCCTIEQVAETVRNALVREGVAHGIYLHPNDQIWFGRTLFNIGESSPDKVDVKWDVGKDALMAEINRLKSIGQEKDYQIESYELARSREAHLLRPAEADFRTKYQTPPDSVAERSRKMYSDEEDYESNKRRRF